jgi:hypothetical protein
MALIDLQTDLKSLKYGKDRIGGGSSNQPFVQKPIPDSFSAVGNTGGLDVLTRGGSLVFQRTADDVSRLTKLLLTGNTFQGPFFTIKQNVLSRQGVQTQASPKGLNEGAYLPTNTLAQVAVSATGLHFNKQGLNPIPGTPGSLTTYSDIVEGSFLNPGIKSVDNNRLIKFTDNFVNGRSGNILYSYSGGPGSILGLGKTSIQTPVDQRTGRNGLNYNPAEDRIKLYPTSYTVETPQPQDFDNLGNVDIEANQFGSPSLLNVTNTTEVTVNGPVSIRQSNNYANLNSFVVSSTTAGLTIDPALSYQQSIPGSARNIKLITLKTAPAGTRVSGINLNNSSKYAKENNLTGSLYQPVTSSLVTLSSLRIAVKEFGLGTRNNIDRNANSDYAKANNLTGSLYIPVTGGASNSGSVIAPFLRTSEPSKAANPQSQVLDNTQAFTYTPQQLKDAPSYRVDSRTTDFRKTLKDSLKGQALKQGKLSGALTEAPDYTTENIEERVHLGNPGDPLRNLSDYTKGTGLGPLDTLNAITLYQSANVRQDNQAPVNDLVKFRIAVIEPDGQGQKTFIHFRAFLDTITDNYSADWSSHRYVGRGENFWTYQGFDRTISLGWTVYAQSREELIPMYKRLNYLASSLAPSYNNGFMRGLLCQLTIGGYVYEQPGFIKSLTYELSDQSTWEIGINDKGFTDPENKGDALVKELPHMIRVTGFNFTPIHTFIPEVQKNTYGEDKNVASFGEQRYIALANGTGSAANNYDS